jgi:spore coat polysaccharide biosynthesis protein SpsF
MSATAIIQARLGSTRLPGKVLRPILDKPMLAHIVERVRSAPGVGRVVVATSDKPPDVAIVETCARLGIACFTGSELDVLDRFYKAAKSVGGDPLVRITADCPLADPELIGRVVAAQRTGNADYVSVATGAGAAKLEHGRFPDGLDAECFSFAVLDRAWREAKEQLDREHVTPYIWRNTTIFRCRQIMSEVDYSHLRWTVDNETDFALVTAIYEALSAPGRTFGMQDILTLLKSRPDLAQMNASFIGAEGYEAFYGTQR